MGAAKVILLVDSCFTVFFICDPSCTPIIFPTPINDITGWSAALSGWQPLCTYSALVLLSKPRMLELTKSCPAPVAVQSCANDVDRAVAILVAFFHPRLTSRLPDVKNRYFKTHPEFWSNEKVQGRPDILP
jgi:hypothetical protein